MENVALPPDFWDDFKSEVGGTDDLHRNHEMLEKLTLVYFLQKKFYDTILISVNFNITLNTNELQK